MSGQKNLLRLRLASALACFSLLAGMLSACGPETTPTPVPLATSTAAPLRPTATTATAGDPTPTTPPLVADATPTEEAGVIDPTATTAPQGGGPRTGNRPRFASYNSDEPASPVRSLDSYTVEADLSNVSNPDDFPLTAAQRETLAKYAFVVAPPPDEGAIDAGQGRLYRQFYQVYEDGRYSDLPAFVTTDSVLHVYHLMFDKVLRTVETDYLTGYLKQLTGALLAESQRQYQQLAGTPAADDALRNVAYLAVAQKLIDPSATIPAEVEDRVEAELALIEKHEGLFPSNIFDEYTEDYSQYVPRGHYTRNEELMNYFRTMMWYGRMTFRLKDAGETRSAILLSLALNNSSAGGASAVDLWRQIYEPTVFFVGEADDLSYFDYEPLIAEAFGAAPQPADLNDEKLATFMAAAQELRGPRINSMFVFIDQDKEEETKGLRLMGQRFTIDAYVFGQLVWRNVGSAPEPDQARWLPKALDFPAALGSAEAYAILEGMGETSGPANLHYPEQMAKVQAEIAGLPEDEWTQNLYWGWLHTFRPLLEPTADEGYPQFMRSQAWQRKELHTVLGSFTELKHDTVLYAKQVMAEAGMGAPGEPPKGYVEPYPAFYARVAALVRMTMDGLSQRGLLPETLQSPLQQLEQLARDLQTISEKELVAEPLTEEEYQLIQFYGATLEHLTYAAADLDGEGRPTMEDQESALVTDIATDPNGFVLQEATGRPTEIFVVAPVEGQLTVTRGAVYTQYEFRNEISNRLTDEQWKQMIQQGNIPDLADWTDMFVVE